MPQSPDKIETAPPGCPAWITPALIAETIRVWQPYYAEPLTTEDAIAMLQAVGRLLETLSPSSSR